MISCARIWIAGSLFALASAGAFAACEKSDPECDPPSAWREFNDVTINATQVGSTSTATYHALFDWKKSDIMIDVDVRDPEQGMHGVVGMIGGRVMISKGVALKRGYELDALDGPVLTIQLVEIILGRALPQGPASLTLKQTSFDYAGKAGIKFATPSAGGRIELPWSAKGSARKSKSGSIDFTFDLNAGKPGSQDQMRNRIVGSLAMSDSPVFIDLMTLDGWTVYGGGAQGEMANARTIGDIRAFIAAQEKSGAAKAAPGKSR